MKKTKKRALYIIAALFAVLFVAACLAGFAACGGNDEGNDTAHTHSYTSSVTKEPTCTEKGVRTYVCSCGDTYTEDMDALGHSWDEGVTTAATCDKDGQILYTCTVCGATTTETIQALGHDLTTTTTDATCTAGGTKTESCSRCDYTVTTTTSDPLGHELVGTYTPGAGDEAGTWTYACSVCNDNNVTLTAETPVKSLTLDATDYDSLKAAGAWNEASLDDVTPLIDVTAAISMTADVDVKDCAKDMILNADITVTSGWTLNVYTDMTLDLNGHSISVTTIQTYDYYVVQVGSSSAYGNLTVKDSSANETGKISSVGAYVIGVIGAANSDDKTSVFTLEGGTIESTYSPAADSNVKGYVIRTEADKSGSSNGAEVINIEGGTVKSTGSSGRGVELNNGTLNVSGGTISGYYGVTVYGLTSSNKEVTVNVTGGTIDGTAYGISTNGDSQYGMEIINVSGGTVTGGLVGIFFTNGSLTVTGGEISGATGIEIRGGTLTISNSTVTATGSTASVDWENDDNNGAISSGYAIANTHTNSYSDASVTIGENVTLTGGVYTIVFNETQLDWAVALDNVTMALGADIAVSDTVTISTTVTLDLNGCKLSCATDDTITVTAEGDLTVIDSSEEGTGVVDATAHGKAALVNEGGTVTLNGGTFERSAEASTSSSNSGGNSYYTVVNHGTMTINDGVTIFNKGAFSSNLENGWYDDEECDDTMSATLTINGGHIYGGLYAIKNDSCGTLYIHGGTIGGARSDDDTMPYRALLNWNEAYIYGGTLLGGNGNDSIADYGDYGDGFAILNTASESEYASGKLVIGCKEGETGPTIKYEGQGNATLGSGWGYAIYMDGGTVTINGGTVWGQESNYTYGASGIYIYSGTLEINGGTISGYYSLEIDGGEVTINGGTFAEAICHYTDDYSNNGMLTFGDEVKDKFEKKMYDDNGETNNENDATYIEYTQKTETENDEGDGNDAGNTGDTGDAGNGGDDGGNTDPGEQEP